MHKTITPNDCVKAVHPLDPLSAEEITRAASILRNGPAAPHSFRFVAINLHKPEKPLVKSGSPLHRMADSVLIDHTSGTAYEAITNRGFTGDCQDFRVPTDIMGLRSPSYVATQSAGYSGWFTRSIFMIASAKAADGKLFPTPRKKGGNFMRIQQVLLAATAILTGTVGLPQLALAQDVGNQAKADAFDGSEITVTANRREQRLQDVSVAVTSMDSDALDNAGVIDVRDIGRIAPGVVFDGVTSGTANGFLAIRGVAQTDYSAHQESPNSVYLDEVYLASSGMFGTPLYDVGRIEVLRGPQGTLFGRASSGGLVSIIPAKPSATFEGFAEIGYGSYDEVSAEAAVSGPLSDRVRFRVAGKAQYSDGWWKNFTVGGKDYQERKFWGLRGQLEADLSDTLTARVALTYNKIPRTREGAYTPVSTFIDPSTGAPAPLPADVDGNGTGPGNDLLGYRSPYGPRESELDDTGFYENELFQSSLYLDWSVGDVSVNSITNYTKYDAALNEHPNGLPNDAANYGFTQDMTQISQELRASARQGGLQWTVGAYFIHNKQFAPQLLNFPVFSGTDFAYDALNLIDQKYTSVALFGQLEYELTDKLTVIGGLRLTHESKTFDSRLFFNELGNGLGGSDVFDPALLFFEFSPATFPDESRAKETLWSGKIGLDYKPSDDLLVYVSASKGIKTAGFNANLGASLDETTTPFRSEAVYVFEAGTKVQLFDNRVRWNTVVFYSDYDDFQGSTFEGGLFSVGNLEGRLYGVETELSMNLPGDFQANIAASHIDTELKDVQTAFFGVQDTQFAQAPKWTVSGGLSKTFQVGPGDLTLGWNGSYVDERFTSIDNHFATRLPPRFEHNARVTYDLENAGLQFAFWVNNISNQAKPLSTLDLGIGNVLYSYSKPRWFGGSIRKTF